MTHLKQGLSRRVVRREMSLSLTKNNEKLIIRADWTEAPGPVSVPCGLNTTRLATVSSSKRNPCERWQGAKFVNVLDLLECVKLPNRRKASNQTLNFHCLGGLKCAYHGLVGKLSNISNDLRKKTAEKLPNNMRSPIESYDFC